MLVRIKRKGEDFIFVDKHGSPVQIDETQVLTVVGIPKFERLSELQRQTHVENLRLGASGKFLNYSDAGEQFDPNERTNGVHMIFSRDMLEGFKFEVKEQAPEKDPVVAFDPEGPGVHYQPSTQ